jgi:hypothetical protein
MLTISFSLQEKYKEEVVKKYGEGFNYKEPIDDRAIYDNRGGKAHDGEINALFCLTL